jgi:hypothetical protein
MFPRWPLEPSHAFTTDAAVENPYAMFSPMAVLNTYPQSAMRWNGSRLTGGAGSLWPKYW